MSNRERKANELVESGAVTEFDGGYRVNGSKEYIVNEECTECTCPDYQFRGNECKHIIASRVFALQAVPF